MNTFRILAVLCIVGVTVAAQGTPWNFSAAPGQSRPIDDILRQFEKQFAWRINYEDPPYECLCELVDIADPNYRAAHPGASFLIPLPRPLTISIPASIGLQNAADRGNAIDALIGRAVANGTTSFRSIHAADVSHVSANAVKRKNGSTELFVPLLDTPVTFPGLNRSIGNTVDLILVQVATVRGIPIMEGTIPTNLFRNHMSTMSADNESARTVLLRIFDEPNAELRDLGLYPIRIAWDMLYDANEKKYFFNAHSVPAH